MWYLRQCLHELGAGNPNNVSLNFWSDTLALKLGRENDYLVAAEWLWVLIQLSLEKQK